MVNLPTSIVHTATSDEFDYLINQGVWLNIDAHAAADVVNKYFPNLNLLEWISEVSKQLNSVATPPISIGIQISTHPVPKVIFQYYDGNKDDKDSGLALQRSITNIHGDISVSHDYLTIPTPYRANGVSKALTRIALQQYVNMDIKLIAVHADLNNGGYTWARNGFAAISKAEMESILKKGKLLLTIPQFTIIKRFFDNYYDNNPSADAFPIIKWAELPFMKEVLIGTSWHGEIDFKKPNQLLNFILYVNS